MQSRSRQASAPRYGRSRAAPSRPAATRSIESPGRKRPQSAAPPAPTLSSLAPAQPLGLALLGQQALGEVDALLQLRHSVLHRLEALTELAGVGIGRLGFSLVTPGLPRNCASYLDGDHDDRDTDRPAGDVEWHQDLVMKTAGIVRGSSACASYALLCAARRLCVMRLTSWIPSKTAAAARGMR